MKGFRSIKWQLLVWQMLLLAAVLITLLTLHYQLHKRDLIAAVDANLQETLLAVMPIISPPPQMVERDHPPLNAQSRLPPLNHPRRTQQGPEQIGQEILSEIQEHHVYILVKEQNRVQQYGQVPASLLKQVPEPSSKAVQLTRDGNRERIHPRGNGVIVIGRSLEELNAEMAAVLRLLFLIGSGVLLTGFAVGWLIVGRSLRPIKTISETAKTIASGEHHKRIELSDAPEELAGMAGTLNSTFDHLSEMIESHKRFSADASHELRTPIAVIIAQTEAALKRERTTEEYKNILQACLRAGQRMKNMAESLLALTRIDSRSTTPTFAEIDLNTVLSEAVDSASFLSEQHPIEFQRTEQPLTVRTNRDCIHQIVMNLISNAIQHNPDGCAVHVSLSEQGEHAVINISDEGTGINEEHLAHIFERFYRVDKSRSRNMGGAGLGLSIVKKLVEIIGGTIDVESQPGTGTTFIITLNTGIL